MLTLEENPPQLLLTSSTGETFVCPVADNTDPRPLLLSPYAQAFNWFVAEIRSRQDKVVARDCLENNIPYYLPTRTTRSKSRNRVFTLTLPGFVFIAPPPGLPEEDTIAEIKAHLRFIPNRPVWNFIHTQDPGRLRRDLALLADKSVLVEDQFCYGQTVHIQDGPYAGLEGILVSTGDENVRVQLSLQVIGVPLSVEVPIEFVRP